MNVYQCWYRGLSGYCCRGHNSRWMFVPELGQPNNRIHKHVSLHDLVFDNPFAKKFELRLEQSLEQKRTSLFFFLKDLFFPPRKPNTVGGLLFAYI